LSADRGEELQAGIYLRPGKLPPAFLFAVLDFVPGCGRAADALGRVWEMLAELRRGVVREEGVTIDPGTFDALLGYGARFFEPGRGLSDAARPESLVPLEHPRGPFASLRWAPGIAPRSGEGDVCLQLTGRDAHAVGRAAVETWKLIADESLPLTVRETYDGFARDDGRSWIGFHDGVSNIRPSKRLDAVRCPGDPGWNRGGTYLAFLRCAVDLVAWRALPREQQEVLVGRDKLSGRALERVEREGDRIFPRAFPPSPAGAGAVPAESEFFLDPPETGDPVVEASHIHRANQNRAEPSTHAGHRIFRQGYEYLDGIGPAGPALGLNFVSFQRDLEHLRQILGLADWLGGVNFGGRHDRDPGEPEPPELITLRAGGFYAVPPEGSPFPGAGLLGD
jgi:deferrochelatase/peroxidase EfeB